MDWTGAALALRKELGKRWIWHGMGEGKSVMMNGGMERESRARRG
jgi:hypothetical protein